MKIASLIDQLRSHRASLHRASVAALVVVLAGLVALSACSVSVDSGGGSLIIGQITKGPVANARVNIYLLGDNGERGQRIAGPFITNLMGGWRGTLPESLSGFPDLELDGPFEVVATGGNFTDEVSRRFVTLLATDEISGIMSSRHQQQVSTTPLTHAMLLMVKERLASGNNGAKVEVARSVVAAQLAFGFDVTTVFPFIVTSSRTSVPIAEMTYTALLGGLSHLLEYPALTGFNVLPLFQRYEALISDLSDGRLNGLDAKGVAIVIPTGVGSETLNWPALDVLGITPWISATRAYVLIEGTIQDVVIDDFLQASF